MDRLLNQFKNVRAIDIFLIKMINLFTNIITDIEKDFNSFYSLHYTFKCKSLLGLNFIILEC